jgi:SagB-type dehydrogenase family enzyme
MLDVRQTIKLGEENTESGVSLDRCIRLRRSVRGFRDEALTTSELGQLLWAVQGVTGADAKRAVPSAGALYPLELYVAVGKVTPLAAGAYHYLPGRHELVLCAPGHQRAKLVDAARGQDWIAMAPAIICIAARLNGRP